MDSNKPVGDRVTSSGGGTFTLPPITLKPLPNLWSSPPSIPNPLSSNPFYHPFPGFYISPADVIVRNILFDLDSVAAGATTPAAYLRAGPRKAIHFDSARVTAAVVTCGGLCPGMNTVIRELVVGLWELYGVREIYGVTSGYRGFYSDEPVKLDPKMVHDWHKRGGTVLTTSRGGFDLGKIVDAIEKRGFNQAIHFDSARVTAAVVTCGGLCPGMNTVIRELVVGLWELYGVREIYGVTSGYRGFYSDEPVKLDPKMVHDWHKRGGTVLTTSRGGFDLGKIVDAIEKRGFNQVYCIGGDGTMRGAVRIFEEVQRRKLNISITGIPKTVDNDIGIIDRSFGFQTAVEMAQQAINAAHVEAESAVNGIGLVKLMGRSTGHIALHATLSSRDVDCCLIPENDFYLEGKGGLFEFLEQRLKENGHAVIVVAEGAGQKVIPRTEAQKEERDESGNPVFLDVGPWLKSELKSWWERDHKGELFTVKYIDPTYMIRAVPANATDNLYCTLLAHSSIHGVMAGYTGFVSGPVNGNYAYIPLEEVAVAKNAVDTTDHKWAWVRSVTNQPDFRRP